MLVPDLGPGEPGRAVLEELGISEQVEVARGSRGNVFPDFTIERPETYAGPYWRRDFFKDLFPEDAGGIDRYYEVYDRVHDLLGLRNQSGLGARLRLLQGMLQIRRIKNWSAEQRQQVDAVVASGGARELFANLIGREHLPARFLKDHVDNLAVTSSVFMVHLGVDFDPSVHQNGQALCYYYSTYEIEPNIRELEAGVYHEGRDGWVVYIPSKHSPEMAPTGHHVVTLYTVAPDTLAEGSWAERAEEFGDRLVSYAERYLPGLGEHTVTRVLYTPDDFRHRTALGAHAFGGVTGAMTGASKTVGRMTRLRLF